ncbi:MAG: SseB family protein [Elusimicrobia bacterium]|nr:SseB family protein [Elusimicrobiota bacterium]
MDLPDNQRLRACFGRPQAGAATAASRQVYEELLRAKLIVPVQGPPKGTAVGLMFTQAGGRTGLPVFTNPEDMKKALPAGMQVMALDARTIFQMASTAQPRIDSILIDPCGAHLILEREAFQALAVGAIPGADVLRSPGAAGPSGRPEAPGVPGGPPGCGIPPAPGAPADPGAVSYQAMPQVADDILSGLREAGASHTDILSCWLFCVAKPSGAPRKTIGFEVSAAQGPDAVKTFMASGPVRRALVRCGVTDALIIGEATMRQLKPVAVEVFHRRAAVSASAQPKAVFLPLASAPAADALASLLSQAAAFPAVKGCWLFLADTGQGPVFTMGFEASGREGLTAARSFWELPAVRVVTERLGVAEVMVLSAEDFAMVKSVGTKVFRRGWFGL